MTKLTDKLVRHLREIAERKATKGQPETSEHYTEDGDSIEMTDEDRERMIELARNIDEMVNMMAVENTEVLAQMGARLMKAALFDYAIKHSAPADAVATTQFDFATNTPDCEGDEVVVFDIAIIGRRKVSASEYGRGCRCDQCQSEKALGVNAEPTATLH